MGTTTRRDALKFIGLGIGSAAIAPSVLFQACKKATTDATYSYATFSGLQASALRLIQDTILPKTDTPSASEMGSVEFADAYVTHGFKEKERNRLLYQLDRFAERLKTDHGGDMDNATPEQMASMMDTYFVKYKAPENKEFTVEIEGNKVTKVDKSKDADDKKGDELGEDSEIVETAEGAGDMNTHEQAENNTYNEAVAGNDELELNDLLTKLRWMTMESYFLSEYIGEEVLNYEEVPGRWVGQLPISELPRAGRAWSL